MKNDWVSTKQASEYLGVHQVTVVRWINEGRLPAWRVGHTFRIERSVIQDFAQPVIAGTVSV